MSESIPGSAAGRAGATVVRAALAKNGRWASVIAAAGGFVSDVLQPIAPFAAYLALTGAIASGLMALLIFARLAAFDRLVPALVFSVLVTMVSGGVWQMQRAEAADNGILAGLVPGIARLQQELGLVSSEVAALRRDLGAVGEMVGRIVVEQQTSTETIKAASATIDGVRATGEATRRGVDRVEDQLVATTDAARQAAASAEAGRVTALRAVEQTQGMAEGQRRIEALTRDSAAGTARVAAVTDRMAVTMEEMARSLERLAGTGGLIADARTAPELYHNARIAEARGDSLAARRSYLQFASLDIDAVDAWSRLATVIRVQDGRAGAREVFASLAGRIASPAYELIGATLYDDADRRRRIETFVAMNPDYGPGWFFLADEYSEARLGSQTLSEKRRERDALARFLEHDGRGTLTRRFMDQSLLGDWLAQARRRRAVLEAALSTGSFEPRAIFTRSNSDWSVYVQLPEPAIGFAYRLGESGPFVQAGAGFGTDARTGRPMPNTNISIVPGAEPRTIEVTYQDLRGTEVGPFRIPFEPMSALVGQQKQTLEMTKGSWVTFREWNGLAVYTTHLVTYRCTILRAAYGLDSQPVDRPLPLPPCDPKDPFAVPAGEQPYFKVPPGTRSMTVRLEFRDGTLAETTIPRR